MNNNSPISFFKKPVWWISILVPLVLVLAACQPSAAPSTAQAVISVPEATKAPSVSPTPAASAEAVINVATDARLGKILVDGKGMTLYIFTKDEPNKSNCGGNCLKAWPPLLTQGNPKLGAGVDASLIGTATLTDGSKIVTYNKMPLYYYAADTKSGDTTGQGVNSVWYVVSPDGKPIVQ